MATDETEEIELGCRVRAKGLVQSAQHNGKTAVIIALADPATGRFGVRLHDGHMVSRFESNCATWSC
jgi:hypothetical protein